MGAQALNVEQTQVASTVYCLTFHLNNVPYGIDVDQIQEILPFSDLTTISKAPKYIIGCINLRGYVVDIIDLRARLGLQEIDDEYTSKIVVVVAHDHLIGLVVDNVIDLININDTGYRRYSTVNDEPNKLKDSIRPGSGNETLILLDIDELLFDQLRIAKVDF